MQYEERRRVKVLFPLPLFKSYDYFAPAGVDIGPGAFVLAPFGPREIYGVVWPGGGENDGGETPPNKLKQIIEICDAAPLAPDIIDFVEWMARYTLFPAGSVLRMVMRSGDGLRPPKMQTGYVASGASPGRMTPQRKAVLDAAMGRAPMSARALAELAGASEAVVRGLAKAGALTIMDVDPDPAFAAPDLSRAGNDLSAEQRAAAERICGHIETGGRTVTLIDGVTGSGKTEVYLEAAAAALGADPSAQVLILIPEIALTLPFLARVEERFGAAPAPWHSGLTGAQRRRTWRRVVEGQARLVAGARSALFLPFKNLRLIIVDEEHDSAYKQEDGVIYHARDMAVARGARGHFPVVLASATPSLETVINVGEGRYDAVGLRPAG